MGSEVFEKPVTVELDPSLTVTPAALRETFDAARELTALRSEANDLLRRLDDLKLQVEERGKLAASRHAGGEVAKVLEKEGEALKGLTDGMARPEGRPVYSEGPRVVDRLAALFFAIDGVNLAPTAAQRALLAELRQEARATIDGANRHFGEALKGTNDALRAADLPEIGVPKPAR